MNDSLNIVGNYDAPISEQARARRAAVATDAFACYAHAKEWLLLQAPLRLRRRALQHEETQHRHAAEA